MALSITPRSKWGAKPAKSFVAADPKAWKGVVCHWFGSPKAAHDHAGCPALLRSVQRTHMAPGGLGVKAGGADIAYNVAVCPHGVAYALRGLARRTGANGTSAANRDYCAVVAMIGAGDKPSGELKDTLREVIAHVRSLGAGPEVITHGSITGSACPGPELSAWVRVKAFEPKPAVKKPTVYPPGVLPNVTSTAEFRVDVDVPGRPEKLRDQDPASPVVAGRIEAWKKRFPSVSVLWKRK